ncbi:hypothetical protein GCM10011586_26070 [Silvibacterium dinghuense]|nr:hypothetical protein GCM10011586_26070 [Silvibacterium dinghuense]
MLEIRAMSIYKLAEKETPRLPARLEARQQQDFRQQDMLRFYYPGATGVNGCCAQGGTAVRALRLRPPLPLVAALAVRPFAFGLHSLWSRH